MSDFSDRPLVAGTITGLRAFNLDSLGRLTGVSHARVFKPGENVAECGNGGYYARSSGYATAWLTNSKMFRQAAILGADLSAIKWELDDPKSTTSEDPVETPSEPVHTVAGDDCTCGYYAYFDGSNTYADENTVTAVIEGYGVCTVGEKGFRAEKARLVALVDPSLRPSPGRSVHSVYDRYADWLYTRDALGAVGTVCGAMLALVAGICAFIAPPVTLSLLALALILGAGAAFTGKASFHGIPRAYPSVSPEVAGCPVAPPKLRRHRQDLSLVLSRYPDVPVYPSVKAALAEHPLTPPEPAPIPSPESDPEFWTRSAS